MVSASGGETQWINVPGDPRDNYIAYLEWAGNSHEVVIQQFNRHQDTVRVMLADVRPAMDDFPSQLRGAGNQQAPDDPRGSRRRLDRPARRASLGHDGREFLWLSEHDGWRHIYQGGSPGGTSPRP